MHSMGKEFATVYFDRETAKGRDEMEVKHKLTEILGYNRLKVLGYHIRKK